MNLTIAILLSYLAIVYAASPTKYHHVVPRQVHYNNNGFRPTVSAVRNTYANEDDDDDVEELSRDSSVSSTQIRRPIFADSTYFQNAIPVGQQRPPQPQQLAKRPPGPPQQYRPQQFGDGDKSKESEEEEDEKEEPDRLSLLLPNTKFNCNDKNTGYYADQELNCEVFHYCQESERHSWICPEGFTFHQVHLICMPPGADNICSKSSQFHFVNDYLYKPINLKEHQTKPNVTLRYADRYFPDGYPVNEDEESGNYHRKQPIRVGLPQQEQQHHQQQVTRRPAQPYSATIRPETTIGQVFRSPEEVNISLQQRRPQFVAQRYQESVDY